jgi:TRAP-type mannitol/chloroaromatic compound transport system substrate-binding protein
MLKYQSKVTTDIKQLVSEDLLGSGIDKNIFEAINNVKKSLLEKLSNHQASEEELANTIKELVDNTFKEYTKDVINF